MGAGRIVIANARMYSVSPEAGALWRALLSAVVAKTAHPVTVIDHLSPLPLEQLWSRPDQAGVFMCGLPFSRAQPQPALLAAPVPSPPEFADRPQYWSDFVVRVESGFQTVADTFGHRIAFTVPESQSGCISALTHFMSMAAEAGARDPGFSEIVAPIITPAGALKAVISGGADVAPIDAYALALLRKFRPAETARVRVVGHTAPTPIPPLVASSHGLDSLQAALLGAHRDPSLRGLMEPLMLHRFARPDPASYDCLRSGYEAARAYWRSRRLAEATHPAFAEIFR